MRYNHILKACKHVLQKQYEAKPNGGIIIDEQKLTYKSILEGVEKLIHWVHPELESESLVKVICCKDCQYWQKKNSMCLKTELKRNEGFFCKDGEHK